MNVNVATRTIWDYMILNEPLEKADVILALGSIDEHVAEYAAKLFMDGYGDWLMFSGGAAHDADLLATNWPEATEAEHFASITIKNGVSKEKIILEKKATNTGENARFSYELLRTSGIKHDSITVVQKPYMERRTYATFKKQWPDPNTIIHITSSPFAYEDYFEANKAIPKDTIINIMVGDLQRLKEYPALGFQIKQDIPDNVLTAFECLVEHGYDKHLIKC